MATTTEAHQPSIGSSERVTDEGVKLTYHLEVLQEPARARACGQGAKSSSDRRPVDPPPIVKLRILQADNDITFTYNANFFLFATLENSRPIAYGRLPQQAGSSAVLTGTPVAGMSYLDRPDPAGYFIFPDLSVRHEGKYRLVFTLYEELKDLKPVNMEESASGTRSGDNVSSVFGRCHVKSSPFDVFSAKRFPGLAESTHLSRLVADQGCRVRIRRDVRMRRRDSKHDREWENIDDEETVEGAPPGAVFDSQGGRNISSSHRNTEPTERPNSISNAGQPPAYQPPVHGQSSSHDLAHQYSYGYGHPDACNVSQSYPPHMYDQARAHQQSQPPYMHQHHMPQQSHSGHQFSQPPYGCAPQHPPPVSHSYGYAQPHQMQSSIYDQPQQPAQTPQDGSGYPGQHFQRPNIPPPQFNAQGQLVSSWTPSTESLYNRPAGIQQENQQAQAYQNLQPSQISSPTSGPSLPGKVIPGNPLPPLKACESQTPQPDMSIPVAAALPNRQSFFPGPPPPPNPFATQINAGVSSKRSYGSVFNTHHIDQPMRAGARPQTDGQAEISESSEEDLQDLDQIKIQYRRADGSHAMLSPRGFNNL